MHPTLAPAASAIGPRPAARGSRQGVPALVTDVQAHQQNQPSGQVRRPLRQHTEALEVALPRDGRSARRRFRK